MNNMNIIMIITMAMTIKITCTVAGRRLRAAAMERRGERARRAMADIAAIIRVVRMVMNDDDGGDDDSESRSLDV